MTPDDAAAILNVDRDAKADSIRNAFKLRRQMWHPDRFANGTASERADAAIEFIRITTAFEMLSSASTRPGNGETQEQAPTGDEQPKSSTTNDPTRRGRMREYLGFGNSGPGIREYFGFGSSPR